MTSEQASYTGLIIKGADIRKLAAGSFSFGGV